MAAPSTWRRPTGAGIGRVHDLLDGAEHYIKHLVGSDPEPSGGTAGRRRLRQRRGLRGGARRVRPGRRGGDRDQRRARRLQHQRELRLDPPRAASGGRARSTAPTSASPTTATPTGASRSTRPARWSTVTRSWPSSRSPCAMRARCATTPSWHGDEQPRAAAGDAARGHRPRRDAVGDRYVLEVLRARGLALGGEQSGHVVMPAARHDR